LKSFTAIDVFSGCGGLTSGLKKAGFEVCAGVEFNTKASSVYSENHPEVSLFGDIRQLDPEKVFNELKIKPCTLDLLAGCPPCQGFSKLRSLNRSRVVEDERNELIFNLLDFIKYIQPKTILIENVPDLLLDERLVKFTAIISKMGYFWDAKIVDAYDYGVPQRRKRMILLASRLAEIKVQQIIKSHKTVKDAILNLPKPTDSKSELHRLRSVHSATVQARINHIPKNGGSRTNLSLVHQLKCHRDSKTNGFKDVYGRMMWEKPAPTLTKYCTNPSKGRFLHPEQNRAISLLEAALLQSFPNNYKFDISLGRTAISAMIGEAIPPLMAKTHAQMLREHLEKYS
jgi:DNA (cytosine-5)-methyltransferase 1